MHACARVCVYACVCVQGTMGKLSSKLRKNENITVISFYQIYLPKLHENILKCYGLNSFKEIVIGFNHGF